jgi:hypothetical protein
MLRWTWYRLIDGDIYVHIRLVEWVLRENNAGNGRVCNREGDHDPGCRESRPRGQSKLILLIHPAQGPDGHVLHII